MTSSEIIKVVLLGESKVGKTSILYQYQEGKFNPDVQPSNTAQFFRKELNLADKGKATLDIWDMSGATKYRSLAKIFLKDAHAAILVYDLADENSFKELKEFWYSQVKDEEGKGFADSIGAGFATVSAKDNVGIQELIEKIAEAAKNKN